MPISRRELALVPIRRRPVISNGAFLVGLEQEVVLEDQRALSLDPEDPDFRMELAPLKDRLLELPLVGDLVLWVIVNPLEDVDFLTFELVDGPRFTRVERLAKDKPDVLLILVLT